MMTVGGILRVMARLSVAILTMFTVGGAGANVAGSAKASPAAQAA